MSSIWIWGRHPVLEAARAGSAIKIVIASGRERAPILLEIREAAERHNVPVDEVSMSDVERLAPGQNMQGVAAQISQRQLRDIDDLLTSSATRTPFYLVLDQIQDPHNFGALLRTANATGVQGVVVPQRHSAPVSGVVAKASAGAFSHTAILTVPNLVRALDQLRAANVWVIGMDGGARSSIFDTDLTIPLAVVVGGEGTGLRRLTREHCDLLMQIPMFGAVESLNASVAGSVVMYEVVRQRLAHGQVE